MMHAVFCIYLEIKWIKKKGLFQFSLLRRFSIIGKDRCRLVDTHWCCLTQWNLKGVYMFQWTGPFLTTSNNGVSHIQHQAITWTNDVLSFVSGWVNFIETQCIKSVGSPDPRRFYIEPKSRVLIFPMKMETEISFCEIFLPDSSYA